MQQLRLTKHLDMLALSFVTLIILAISIFFVIAAVMSHNIWESMVPILLILMWIIPIGGYKTFGLFGLINAVLGSWILFGVLNASLGDYLPIFTLLRKLGMEHFILSINLFASGIFLYLLFSMVFSAEFTEDITLKKLFRNKRYIWSEITKASATLVSEDAYILELVFEDSEHIRWQVTSSQLQQWHALKNISKIELVNSEETIPDSLEFSSISSNHYLNNLSSYLNGYTVDEAAEFAGFLIAFIGSVYGYGMFGILGAIVGYIISLIAVSLISYFIFSLLQI